MHLAGSERMHRFFAALRMLRMLNSSGRNYFTVTVSNCAPLTT